MKDDERIIVDRVDEEVEENQKTGEKTLVKYVIDKAGEKHKIKHGKMGEKWDLLSTENDTGKAMKLKYGQFKGYDFISDFEYVVDEFEKQAIEKVQTDNKELGELNINKRSALDKTVNLAVSGLIPIIPTDKEAIDWKQFDEAFKHLLGLLEPAYKIMEVINENTQNPAPVKSEDSQPALELPDDSNADSSRKKIRNLIELYAIIRTKEPRFEKSYDSTIKNWLAKGCSKQGWSVPTDETAEDFYFNTLAPYKGWV